MGPVVIGKLGKRILIVDDSLTMRQIIRLTLEKQFGCTVVEAADGVGALEKLRGGEAFDCIVTDINMPRLDGLALIQLVRGEMGRALPIIVITTRGSEKDRDRALALGADTYLTKPFDGASLGRSIASLVGKEETSRAGEAVNGREREAAD